MFYVSMSTQDMWTVHSAKVLGSIWHKNHKSFMQAYGPKIKKNIVKAIGTSNN